MINTNTSNDMIEMEIWMTWIKNLVRNGMQHDINIKEQVHNPRYIFYIL